MEDVRVVILAGGKGTRLRPYTTVLPKPLVPIGETPILEVILRQLKHHGFRRVTLSVNHLAHLIRSFFGDGSALGLDIEYCIETEPLGTAGSLSLVEGLTDPFLVMNGDLLTTLDYAEMVRFHRRSGNFATIGAFPRDVAVDFGVLDLDAGGALVQYHEKPTLAFLVSMGVNVLSRDAAAFIEPHRHLDLPALMMKLKDAGRVVGSYRSDCRWLDIGRVDDYEAAVELFERDRKHYLRD